MVGRKTLASLNENESLQELLKEIPNVAEENLRDHSSFKFTTDVVRRLDSNAGDLSSHLILEAGSS